MNPSEELRYTLSIRDDLHRRYPDFTPPQIEAVVDHFKKLKDVATPKEDGSFTFLGESVPTAIDGVVGLGRGVAAPVNLTGAVVLPTEEEAAAKLGGYTLQEFRALPGDKKFDLASEARGDPGLFWNADAKPRAYGGLSASEVSRLSPEEKIALGNESARGQS